MLIFYILIQIDDSKRVINVFKIYIILYLEAKYFLSRKNMFPSIIKIGFHERSIQREVH
jgi:hypothetical protein